MSAPIEDANLPVLKQPPCVDDMVWLQAHSSAELDVALEATRRQLPVHVYEGRAALDAAIRRLAEQPARFVVFAQPRRGMWNPADVEAVHHASLLTELIGVYGSWCEGWQRTGQPLPGVHHYYWHQWPLRVRRLMTASPQLRTATNSESHQRMAAEAERFKTLPTDRPVAISADYLQRDAIRDALATVGCRSVAACGEPTDSPFAVLWDGDVRDTRHRQRLDEVRSCHPSTPLLALTVAPRLEDWQCLQAANAAVLSKPSDMGDVYGWLADLLMNEHEPAAHARSTGEDDRMRNTLNRT